ncbi:MAG: pirin family protein [Polyangiaceae bacterium]|nr:pirin family protein [Polyangiaceae bacterium]
MPSAVLETKPLGFPWVTVDPFLFCVHHLDAYPAGNERFGPAVSLAGRDLGQDFEIRDGFRMYHGHVVPGFPQHPHRGFETVTIVRRGLCDHSDSLGAAARFGNGDAQWITAGRGIVHSEMFPLLRRDAPNPLELFQIWLNLPAQDKLAEPHFSMLWSRQIPTLSAVGESGARVDVRAIAGTLDGRRPPAPPPRSWASRPDSDVAIWTLRLDAGASFELPPAASPETVRTLYFFRGGRLTLGDDDLTSHAAAVVRATEPVRLRAADGECELLMLQGRPIGEPVVQHGPFVMNTRAEIEQTFQDYRQTRFGGWPWPSDDPVHGSDEARFARHVDGRVERVDDPLSA